MAEEGTTDADFEAYCLYCGRPLTENDDIHFVLGPFGYDIDIMCGECREQRAQAKEQVPDLDSLSLAEAAELGIDPAGGLDLEASQPGAQGDQAH